MPLIRDANQRLQRTHTFLCRCQQADGAIRWYPDGKLDPWDHTEAAMALTVLGDLERAKKAYCWLKDYQNADGSWFTSYFEPTNTSRVETNFVAYPATGIWHYFLVTHDRQFLQDHFPLVEHAIDFVLLQQQPEGDILWAVSADEDLAKDALVTASSSILRSLECAILIARELGKTKSQWQRAYSKLADALLNKPWRFDRTWESKSRYSMDWFYPLLTGIFSTEEAQLRLQKRWYEFVEENLGCRCVSDEPWITAAESSELVIACVAAGKRDAAESMYKQLAQWQDSDGGFWTGYSFRDKCIWPQEKTSWTAAAFVLASDALLQLSPASTLFTSRSTLWQASQYA